MIGSHDLLAVGAGLAGMHGQMETITSGRRAGNAAAAWAAEHTTVEVSPSQEADAERELRRLLERAAGGRGRSARSSQRQCTATSASSAASRTCSSNAS